MLLSPLKYNQTWEDPAVDQMALTINPADTVLCLVSGGCNVLNTALLKPKLILAIDNNPAQCRLLQAKIQACKNLPYSHFWRLFGQARDLKLRGSLAMFSVLGWCIRHLVGTDKLTAWNYAAEVKPRLWRWFTSHVPSVTLWAYGLSFRQIIRLLKYRKFFLKDVFYERLEYVFSHPSFDKNYFWHRVIWGNYKNQTICPPYLQKNNYSLLKKSVNRIVIHNSDLLKFLQTRPRRSITKFNLSDVVEFYPQKKLSKLWTEVDRTAKAGSRVLYRTVGGKTLIPDFFSRFIYLPKLSAALTRQEQTGSYAIYVYEVNANHN